MLSYSPNQVQLNMFKATIIQFVDAKHPLIQLAEQIPWSKLEAALSKHYSHTGSPAKPIRLMLGLLVLKQLYNLSDENVVRDWLRDPYFQYFTGQGEFEWQEPCDPSDLVHFRKRIGEQGMELLLQMSIDLHKKQDKKGKETSFEQVIIDTTVQEKNITYPTDVKLYIKVIKQAWKIAKELGIQVRQSYIRTVKKLVLAQRFTKSKVKAIRVKAVRSQKKLRIIGGRLVRELGRKIPQAVMGQYKEVLDVSDRILKQKREDKNKVNSLHEPGVSCISKGKVAKKYEFGSKVSIVVSKVGNVVLGVKNFVGNPHDSKTLYASLEQVERLIGNEVKKAIVDRGYRGRRKVGNTEIIHPEPKNKLSKKEQSSYRRYFKRRAAIEGIISHMKHGYGLGRNYLKGEIGDIVNSLLSGVGFNLQSYLRKVAIQGKSIFCVVIKRALASICQLLGLAVEPKFYLSFVLKG